MTRSNGEEDDGRAAHIDRNGFKLLSIAGGAALGVVLVALGTQDPDAVAEQRLLDGTPPVVAATAAGHAPSAMQAAALDAGVDWGAVEVFGDHGPAAIAAYEHAP